MWLTSPRARLATPWEWWRLWPWEAAMAEAARASGTRAREKSIAFCLFSAKRMESKRVSGRPSSQKGQGGGGQQQERKKEDVDRCLLAESPWRALLSDMTRLSQPTCGDLLMENIPFSHTRHAVVKSIILFCLTQTSRNRCSELRAIIGKSGAP